MKLPPPCFIIYGAARRIVLNAPFNLTTVCLSQSLSESSMSPPACVIAALLTTISMRPYFCTI